MKIRILIFLFLAFLNIGAAPTRQYTYTTGEVISPTAVTGNEDRLFNYLQAGTDTFLDGSIVNADISSAAAIAASKLNLSSISQNVTFSGATTFSGTVSGVSLSAKTGSFSRDTTTASGTQAVTGVGFQPVAVYFMAFQTGTEYSNGYDDGVGPQVVYQTTTAGSFDSSSSFSIYDIESSSSYTGKVTSFDSDGWTITWTKSSSPTGTLTVYYLALK